MWSAKRIELETWRQSGQQSLQMIEKRLHAIKCILFIDKSSSDSTNSKKFPPEIKANWKRKVIGFETNQNSSHTQMISKLPNLKNGWIRTERGIERIKNGTRTNTRNIKRYKHEHFSLNK